MLFSWAWYFSLDLDTSGLGTMAVEMKTCDEEESRRFSRDADGSKSWNECVKGSIYFCSRDGFMISISRRPI